MTTETQAAFARRLGVNRSHITRLKQDGRLVMIEDRLIDIEASTARLIETSAGRDDVAARWARQRSTIASVELAAPPAQQEQQPDNEETISSRASAMARKEHYLALQAKLEYERAIGAVVARADVEGALDDVLSHARAGIEQLPHRVAGQLVQKDFDAVLATLREAVTALMHEMHRDVKDKLAALTRMEPA